MKILKIFGLVVGIHVVAFMFLFAIPGCRSMSRHSPPPTAGVQAERPPGVPEAAYPQSNATNSPAPSPALPPAEAPSSSAVASANPGVNFPLNSGSSSGQRANPTRPGSAGGTAPHADFSAPPVAYPEMTPSLNYVVVAGDSLSKIAKKNNLTTKELAAANNLRPETPIRLGEKLTIPGKATPLSTAVAQPSGPAGDTIVYKVRAGDSLALIAKRAGTTAAALRALNHLKTDTVRPGQDLNLPPGPAAVSLASSPVEPEPSAPPVRGADGAVHHIVKAGESLGIIARHYGVKSSDLAVANNIADPLKVRPGLDLIIPAGKGVGSARPTTASRPEPRSPAPESTPANGPSSPVSSPVDASPIAPSAPPVNAATPPTVEVQEASPIGAPKP